MTTASISPCLQVEPEYTPSPGPLVTGRDSPVSADCEQLKSQEKHSLTSTQKNPHTEGSSFSLHYLINFQWIPFKQTSVSRNDIPKLHTDDVPWHKDCRFLLGPPAISENLYHGETEISTPSRKTTQRCKQDPVSTLALGARRAMRAAAALPALFSSMKLIVELMMSRVMIPTKSCQSGGLF